MPVKSLYHSGTSRQDRKIARRLQSDRHFQSTRSASGADPSRIPEITSGRGAIPVGGTMALTHPCYKRGNSATTSSRSTCWCGADGRWP